MGLYVTISEGASGARARNIVAIQDPQVVQAVLEALRHRLEPSTKSPTPLRGDDAPPAA